MYPLTVTLHNPAQFNAVAQALAKLSETEPAAGPAVPQSIKADKPETPQAAARRVLKDEQKQAEPLPEPTTVLGGKNGQQAVEALDNQHAKPQPSITFDALKAKFVELSKATDGRTKIIDVLARFGAKKLPELKPEQYDQAAADIDRVMAGGEA